jgi:hypothetical protein
MVDKEFCASYFWPDSIRMTQSTMYEMDRTCNMHESCDKCVHNLAGKRGDEIL